MNNKTYILQKDLPNIKAGVEFEWCDTKSWNRSYPEGRYFGKHTANDFDSSGAHNSYGSLGILTPNEVEGNPTWFKLKEEPKRPPLGIEPEFIWKEKRYYDLLIAIDKYKTQGCSIPTAWMIEKSKLENFIANKNMNKSLTVQTTLKDWGLIADSIREGESVSINFKTEKTYTEEDMRKCFESARLMSKCTNAMCRVYNSFEEYLKLISE